MTQHGHLEEMTIVIIVRDYTGFICANTAGKRRERNAFSFPWIPLPGCHQGALMKGRPLRTRGCRMKGGLLTFKVLSPSSCAPVWILDPGQIWPKLSSDLAPQGRGQICAWGHCLACAGAVSGLTCILQGTPWRNGEARESPLLMFSHCHLAICSHWEGRLLASTAFPKLLPTAGPYPTPLVYFQALGMNDVKEWTSGNLLDLLPPTLVFRNSLNSWAVAGHSTTIPQNTHYLSLLWSAPRVDNPPQSVPFSGLPQGSVTLAMHSWMPACYSVLQH